MLRTVFPVVRVAPEALGLDGCLVGEAAVLCGVGLVYSRWFLENTRKGERLVHWFGADKAVWVARGLFGLGLVFGLLLAGNFIRPIQW